MRDGSWPKSEATFFNYDTMCQMHVECSDPTTERKEKKKAGRENMLRELAEKVLPAPTNHSALLAAIAGENACSATTARARFREMKASGVIEKNIDENWQIKTKGQ